MISDLGIVIVAGGSGNRFGSDNKLLVDLAGLPLYFHSVERYVKLCPSEALVLVVPEVDFELFERDLENRLPGAGVVLVKGGPVRTFSVRNGLGALPATAKYVAVHDAARPLADIELMRRCYELAKDSGSGVAAHRVTDTIKRCDDNALVQATLDRSDLWAIETPQVFLASALHKAYAKALDSDRIFTDDAGVMEYSGYPVTLVENPLPNIKITFPWDHKLLELILDSGPAEMTSE